MFLVNYISLLCLLAVAFLITCIIYLLSFLLSYQTRDEEKNSIYECGFVPFNDARGRFEVKYYLVSILFIVFDLEIAFLYPFIVSTASADYLGVAVAIFFVILLGVGFLYEITTGAMEW